MPKANQQKQHHNKKLTTGNALPDRNACGVAAHLLLLLDHLLLLLLLLVLLLLVHLLQLLLLLLVVLLVLLLLLLELLLLHEVVRRVGAHIFQHALLATLIALQRAVLSEEHARTHVCEGGAHTQNHLSVHPRTRG